ncbi:MAG: type II toxin-antitoxin system VapC family toxin [Thermoanaerobaculia bacterium]
MTLDEIASGSRVFIDSTIFIYHFTGVSAECRRFLERCSRTEIRGITSVVALAEVAHRLMMIEALTRELVSAGRVAAKLREKPFIVRQLRLYQEQVEKIPLMGIEALALDLSGLLRSFALREKYGLLTNDSLVAAAAISADVAGFASADVDFERLPKLRLFQPGDLSSSRPARPS